jgi:hypothetical protein
VLSNGLSIVAGATAITGGIASALLGSPVAAIGSQLSGVATNALGQVSGADLNKVVNLAKGAGSQLVASASSLIPPPDSFAAQIQQNQNLLRQDSVASAVKQLQENIGKNSAFLQKNIQSTATAFQTGTNNVVGQAADALSKTPFKDVQFPSTAEVASKVGLDKINSPSAAKFSPTSTNPAGAVVAFQTGTPQGIVI